MKCKLTMRLLRRQNGGTRRSQKQMATDRQKKARGRVPLTQTQIDRSRPCGERGCTAETGPDLCRDLCIDPVAKEGAGPGLAWTQDSQNMALHG